MKYSLLFYEEEAYAAGLAADEMPAYYGAWAASNGSLRQGGVM